jgi:hypothetical protein
VIGMKSNDITIVLIQFCIIVDVDLVLRRSRRTRVPRQAQPNIIRAAAFIRTFAMPIRKRGKDA